MKRNYLFLLLGLITLWSCQSNEDLLPPTDSHSHNSDTRSASEEAVVAQIMASRYGGYDKLRPNTRALEDFTLTPYVEEGDTLLYIAQYPEGWELYTAKTPLPMLVLSCEEGTFNIFDPEMPDPLRATLDNLIAELKQYAPSTLTTEIAGSDNLQANENIKSEIFSVNPDNSIQAVSESDLPPGHWVLIKQEVIQNNSYTSPKLIKTKWGQDKPWNAYAKWLPDSQTGELVQCVAGCVPITIGQYNYYTHFKDGVPISSAAKARITSDKRDYDFILSTTLNWNKMALSKSDITGFSEVALLVGEIGRKVYAKYGIKATGASEYDMWNYLEEIYSREFTYTSYSFEKVANEIDLNYPVQTIAWDDSLNGHAFIIDQYYSLSYDATYTYGWKRDPLPAGTPNTWLQDLVDKDGNIIEYAYKKIEQEKNMKDYAVSMNWGWNGKYDNVFYYQTNPWNAADHNWDKSRKIFLPIHE